MSEIQPVDCPNCPNQGWYEVTRTTIGCCGNIREDGSCCGDGIPEAYRDQEQCEFCHMVTNSKFYLANFPKDEITP